MVLKVELLIIFFILFVGYPFNSYANGKSGYTISGKIAGLKEGEKVTMMLFIFDNENLDKRTFVKQDSAIVENGEFLIKGVVPDGPREYLMIFDKHQSLFNDRSIHLFINNDENISIQCNTDIEKIRHNWIEHYVDIQGSPTNYSVACLKPAQITFAQNIGNVNNFSKRVKDSIGFDGVFLDGIFKTKSVINQVFYSMLFRLGGTEPEYRKGGIFLPTAYSCFKISGHASYWIDAYNLLEESYKNSFHGKWLKELTKLCIGQFFPQFKFPALNGTQISLKEVLAGSKLTVVHFWASHSNERGKCQDELKVLYRKYHDKGLNVIGVSSDSEYESWRSLLQTEQYPWYNVIDLMGRIVSKEYHEYGEYGNENTTNVLLDNNAKIIAWDVKGGELEWYLWSLLEKNNL